MSIDSVSRDQGRDTVGYVIGKKRMGGKIYADFFNKL